MSKTLELTFNKYINIKYENSFKKIVQNMLLNDELYYR